MSETARRADTLVENMADGVLILDRDGTVLWARPTPGRLDLQPQQLTGQPAAESLHGPEADRFRAGLAKAVANPGMRVRVGALHLVSSHDPALTTDDTLTFLPDTPGINGVLLLIQANELHGLVEEAPSGHVPGETEEQLRQVVRLSHIGVFDHNHLTQEVYWSPEHRRIYGWGETDPVVLTNPEGNLQNVSQVIHPDDWERVAAAVERSHSGEGDSRFDLEYRIIRPDGALRWVAIRSQTFFEGKGSARHPVRTVGAVEDVTERKSAERQIELMQMSVDRCNTAIYWVNSNAQVTYANDHACQSLGMPRDELIGLHVWDFDPNFRPDNWSKLWDQVKRDKSTVLQTQHRRKDGTVFPIEALGTYLLLDEEEIVFVFVQDITERKRAELALRTSEERLRQVALVYNIGTFELDMVAERYYWSPELRRYWGIGPQERVTLATFQDAIHPEDRAFVMQSSRRAHDPAGDGLYNVQHRIIRPDGSVRWIDMRAQTFFEGAGALRHATRVVGALVDITERREAEEILRHSLHEKETLLREVHHRVKNNLQIIASLLHFQAKKVKHPEDLAAFVDGRDRLRSMILVHEKLYQSPDLSRVDLATYLKALVRDLHHSYLDSAGSLDIRIEIEPLALPIESALPCGMILCELLTNVFKYAFPDARRGRVSVSLAVSDGLINLGVHDDGVGLPASFDADNSTTFGWQLIRNLIAQLNGAAKVKRRDGTQVVITFPRPVSLP